MKNLLMSMSVLLLSFTARAEPKIKYLWPSVNGLAVNKACSTENSFKSLTPVPFCSDLRVTSRQACRMGGEIETCRNIKEGGKLYSGEYFVEQKSCYQTSTKEIEVSRMVTNSRCVQWTSPSEVDVGQCLKTETTTYKAGTNFKVMMFEDGTPGPKNYLGELDFTVPECK